MKRLIFTLLLSSSFFKIDSQVRISSFWTYDRYYFEHNSKNGLSAGLLGEIPFSKSKKWNVEFGLGYSYSLYSYRYDGYPGFPACYFDTIRQPNTETANFCLSRSIYEKEHTLKICLGVNYIQKMKHRCSLEYGILLLPAYTIMGEQHIAYFGSPGQQAQPIFFKTNYSHSEKAIPDAFDAVAQIKFRIQLNDELSLFARMCTGFYSAALGVGAGYQLK